MARLGADAAAGVGAPTLAETGLVLTARLGGNAGPMLSRIVHEFGLAIIPFSPEHWRTAVDAYARYGKGRHRAGLNFGDCLSYAIARLARQPLLYVGRDFAATDLPPA